ncbi:hypothetical protein [Myxosarcina sp. GI1]|uniref:hypothetical protein n=1 Tax=Myxosarcina sp. GI1 TaxID=1541065 RepID=UPI0005619731|nr:hypothetical protein [Myxosarcina sp. GI1]
MSTNCFTQPKFELNQTVSFIGGIGKIKDCQLEINEWTYTVEMIMNSEPDFGRIGTETTIVLEESDIRGVVV